MIDALILHWHGHHDYLSQARCYAKGVLVKKNEDKAIQLYQTAITTNPKLSFFHLAKLHEKRLEMGLAISAYCQAAIHQHADARHYLCHTLLESATMAKKEYADKIYFQLGCLYVHENDIRNAINYLNKAACLGQATALQKLIDLSDNHAEASFCLANIYKDFHNTRLAIDYYLKAKQQFHPDATLAIDELTTELIIKLNDNAPDAYDNLLHIARHDLKAAQELAHIFEAGEKVKKNISAAFRCLASAAYQGDQSAKKRVKSLAKQGNQKAKLAFAEEYYQRQNKTGKAINLLLEIAYQYEQGQVNVNRIQNAIKFYSKASILGSGSADFRLGELYQIDCLEQVRDTEQAIAHYQKALAHGQLAAKTPLNRLLKANFLDLSTELEVSTTQISSPSIKPADINFLETKQLKKTAYTHAAKHELSHELPDQIAVEIDYAAYEEHLTGGRPYAPAYEADYRRRLMKGLLDKNGWTFIDVHQNLNAPSLVIDRDEDGWLALSREFGPCRQPVQDTALPDDPNIPIFESARGLTINYKTGDFNFSLKPWRSGAPVYLRLLTPFDIYEVLAKNFSETTFSLDPVDPKKRFHPFNTLRFHPPSLYGSEFLQAHLITDYLLKQFTTGQEIQGQYPYGYRSIDMLIEHLPLYLKKIIYDINHSDSPCSESLHRFWIEASPVAITKKRNAHIEHIALDDMKMLVKKHQMIRNHSGELIDDDNEASEGWMIYILERYQKPSASAIVFINDGSNEVCFIDATRDPFGKNFYRINNYQKQLNTLFHLKRRYNDRVICNDETASFLYQVTREVCKQANMPHRLSKEYIFAQELTIHYDDFAQYFPCFGRLRELSRLMMLVNRLNEIKNQNKRNQPLQTQLRTIGLGSQQNDKPPHKVCFWIPASISHTQSLTHTRVIYGGVRILPKEKILPGDSPQGELLLRHSFFNTQLRTVDLTHLRNAKDFTENLKRHDERGSPHHYYQLLRMKKESKETERGNAGDGSPPTSGDSSGNDENDTELFANLYPDHVLATPKTIPNEQLKSINKKWIYVVTQNNQLIVGNKHERPGGGHIDLAQGKPVKAAGEVRIANGKIRYIDNWSGHYQPAGLSAQRAAENAFSKLGFDVRGKYVEREANSPVKRKGHH